jgi:hypothetical protein
LAASAAAFARARARSAAVMSRVTLTTPPSGVRRSMAWITMPCASSCSYMPLPLA